MKILISWSGDISCAVALVLRDWLPVVLPFVDPWVSSTDIPKGARWAAELAEQLESTNCGVICVTPDNAHERWLHYETGALSKSVQKGRVHPFLLGMKASALDGPLSQFQATEFTEADVRKLIRDINRAGGEATLSSERIERNFAMCWPELKRKLPAVTQREGRDQKITATEAPAATPFELGPSELTMLKLVAKVGRLFPEDGGNDLHMHAEKAKYILETLEAVGLLSPSYNYNRGTSWHLTTSGRAEMVRQGIL